MRLRRGRVFIPSDWKRPGLLCPRSHGDELVLKHQLPGKEISPENAL